MIGRARLIVTALDKDNDFLNFLDMSASVVSPEMKPVETTIRQVAPGAVSASVDASQTGSYVAMISPGPGRARS